MAVVQRGLLKMIMASRLRSKRRLTTQHRGHPGDVAAARIACSPENSCDDQVPAIKQATVDHANLGSSSNAPVAVLASTIPLPDKPWRAAAQPNTKAFFGESISNPKYAILAIESVAGVAYDLAAIAPLAPDQFGFTAIPDPRCSPRHPNSHGQNLDDGQECSWAPAGSTALCQWAVDSPLARLTHQCHCRAPLSFKIRKPSHIRTNGKIRRACRLR